MKKLLQSALALILAFSMQASVFAEASLDMDDGTALEDTSFEQTVQQETVSKFTLPTNQRATVLTPSVDFYTSETDDETTVSAQLDSIYQKISEIGLNSVYINTTYEDVAYFNTDMNISEELDVISLAVSKASEYNLRVYLVFDMGYVLNLCNDAENMLDQLISHTHRFVIKYPCDGIVVDNFYSENDADSYADYMKNGSGIGYENWLYDTNTLYFSTVSDVIHLTDNTVPVGIMIKDMWANSSADETGSATEDPVQAFYDGYSDTKGYIGSGYADFAVVHAYGSLTSGILPFEEVSGWWGALCEKYGIPMYLTLHNEKQGSSEKGWYGDDQILRQMSTSKDVAGCGGNVFYSYASLIENSSLTENIIKFYGDEINEGTLFEDLIMQSPGQFSFTTYEPYVHFMGTFDENFDVYFNGEKIKLNTAGYFYFEEALDIGSNKFTIEHKGSVYTYNIERKIITLKSLDSSIEEGKTLSVNGGTRLTISATAYKGATVTAVINGQTVTLKQSESVQDDEINSSYATYTGQYQVPDGIIGQEQNLGTITVTSSYLGYSRTLYGASVSVLALPEPPATDFDSEMYDQDSAGSGEVVGVMDPIYTENDNVTYIRVASNYTTVYDPLTTGNIPTPNFSQLPAGTLDYFSAASGSYYIGQSGRRYAQSSVTLFSDTGLGENALVVKSTGTSNGDSYFKISTDYKVTFNVELIGNNYYTWGDGDYNLDSMTATHVYITFDNITSVTKLPSFEHNLVFSEGKWETVNIDGIPKFRMVLKLRQPGVYAGNGAYYDNNGDLNITFGVTTNNVANMTVVIDPGHGYCTSSTVFDPGGVGHITEFETNIAIAKALRDRLTSMGANVIMLDTEHDFYLTADRPNIGRAYGCDMFISIHANKIVGNDQARGTEVYYFTPFSQPLAANISANIASYFANNVYSDGVVSNRGAKNSYYWVTLQQDFPSILVETGFVSNYEDAMALVDPVHQQGIANAIADGIVAYAARSSISYASSGTVDVEITEDTTVIEATEDTSVTAEETSAEETTAWETAEDTVGAE